MLIDLSVILNARTPVYPGDPATRIERECVMERDGCENHVLRFVNHVGTHIDAPRHMLAGGKTIEEYPVDRFVGRGRLVDVGERFTVDSLREADVREGDIVLFRTGVSARYHEPDYFDRYPAMASEMARRLVELKVKMVGADAGSVDNTDGFPVHKILLAEDVLIIENLTNLDALVGVEFTVYALPLKLDVDGAPARVIAQVAD